MSQPHLHRAAAPERRPPATSVPGAPSSAAAADRVFDPLLAPTPAGIFVTDLDGTVTLASARWCALAGITPDEARANGWLAAVHPGDRARVARQWHEAIRARRDYETQTCFVGAGGADVPVFGSCVVLHDATGRPTGWVGAFVDLGAQRRVLDELRRQRAFLRHVIDLDPSFIFAKDREGRFTLVNRAVADAYGTTVEALIGRTDADFNHNADEVAHFRGDDLHVMETKREKVIPEEIITDAAGRTRILQTIKRPIVGPDGVANQVLGVSTDITARKQLEDQLAEAQKMEAIGRLAGGVAHDFNNLLTVILGSVDVMLQRLPPDHEMRASTERIRKAAERGAMLTRQLVAFGRRQVLRPRILDLHRVVADSVQLVRPIVGEDVEVLLALDAPQASIRADPAQITQVLLNLAINARDAMPAGGTLTVRTGTVTLHAVGAARSGLAPGEYVTIAVSDTGTGIPPDVLPHVFEPFFTTKPAGRGTGLGLATTYGIVKQSGGHVAIATEVGAGTTFSVLLPRVREAAEPPARPTAPVAGGHETILLVEDEAMVRTVAAAALRERGFRVLEACNGVEALAVARAFDGPIDVLVTDVAMPRMGGRDLAAWLKRLRPDTRVLYTSGYLDDAVLEPDGGQAPVAFLAKPYVAETLALRVREVLDRHDA